MHYKAHVHKCPCSLETHHLASRQFGTVLRILRSSNGCGAIVQILVVALVTRNSLKAETLRMTERTCPNGASLLSARVECLSPTAKEEEHDSASEDEEDESCL